MRTLNTFLLVAVAILATLSGCGPGTGGTGTGPSISVGTPLSPVSGPLTFAGTQNAPAAVFGGSNVERVASVFGPSVSALRTAVLSLDVNRVDLRKSCQGFTFVGAWSIDSIGESKLLGTYSSSKILVDGQIENSTYLATLFLSFADGNATSSSVTAIVKDSAERVLMGPFELMTSTTNSGSIATACSQQ